MCALLLIGDTGMHIPKLLKSPVRRKEVTSSVM